MVYVLQFVISYKSENCIGLDTTKTDKGCAHNLADFHFGEMYQKADKRPAVLARITSQKTSNPEGFGANLLFAANSISGKGRKNPDYYSSKINRRDDVFDDIAPPDGGGLLNGSFEFNTGGTDSKTITVPGFSFFSGNILGKPNVRDAMAKLFLNYDVTNANISGAAANFQGGLLTVGSGLSGDCVGNGTSPLIRPLEAAPCLIKMHEQRDYALKVAYIQTLLIILITLAITFAFLNNVMDFAGKLVGAGVTPVGKALNVYNFTTNRLGKMLKGPVR